MTLRLLREEHADDGVGPLMLEEINRSARRTAPRYVATKYSVSGNWTHGLDDLVQDVAADVLVRDDQAGFLLSVDTLGDFRRLLDWQTRRVLARHRQRTVIDNLLTRARKILADPPFDTVEYSGKTAFWRHGTLAEMSGIEVRAASAGELAKAALAVRTIPVIEPDPHSERAPIVFHRSGLAEVLDLVASTLPCVFTIRELDRILELSLTRFLPSVLDQGGHDNVDRDVLIEASAAARAAYDRMSDPQAVAFALKAAGVSDALVAGVLGVSRPTAADRKRDAFQIVRDEFEAAAPDVRLVAVDLLCAMARTTVERCSAEALELAMQPLE